MLRFWINIIILLTTPTSKFAEQKFILVTNLYSFSDAGVLLEHLSFPFATLSGVFGVDVQAIMMEELQSPTALSPGYVGGSCAHIFLGMGREKHCFSSLSLSTLMFFFRKNINICYKMWIKIATFPTDVHVMNAQMPHNAVPPIHSCKPVVSYLCAEKVPAILRLFI